MTGSYDLGLVAVSVLIAVLAGGAALDLAGRVTAARGRPRWSARVVWIAGGAAAMGFGIWSMHYAGMLAFRMAVPILYDVPTVLVSLLAAIVASTIALFVSSRTEMKLREALIGCVFMGSGIAAMHYTGMAAMRLPARVTYDPLLFGLSVVIAIVVSFVALWLAFHFREAEAAAWSLRKFGSAVVMGGAISGMHYTGMMAARFTATSLPSDVSQGVAISSLATVAITVTPIMVLCLAIAAATVNRRFAGKAADLETSERLLREVIDADPNLIFVKDWNGRFTVANRAVAEVYGTSVEGLVGKTDADFNRTPTEVEQFLRDDRQVMEDRRPKFIPEERVTNPTSGVTRWFQTVKVPLSSTGGSIRQVLGVATEITDRKQAEEALRASEERFRALAASAADAIVSANSRWEITYLNSGAERAFGYAASEVIGQPLMLLLPDRSQDMHYRNVQRRWESGVATAEATGDATGEARAIGKAVELTGKRKDGSEFPVELSLASWGGNDGPSFVAIIRDITERKNLEAQFRQSQKMEAVGRLAGGIAHDFNNLLTAITVYSDLLFDGVAGDDASRADIAQIKRAASRASELTKQLLAFSRRQVLQPKVIELADAVTQVNNMLRRLIGEDIELVTRLDPGTGRVKTDPGQLEQVIVNLALNARDAMPRGGTLTIETASVEVDKDFGKQRMPARPGRYVMFALTDTGVGMDEETQSHLFEPFFTTKEIGKGTGLGLATVYGIVEQSDGFIRVDSEPGTGTTFAIYLPRVDELTQPLLPAHAPVQLRGTETVLVAEDDEAVRMLTRRVLESRGYKVLAAASGSEALAVAQQHPGAIELVVTDVVMPGMGGRELGQRLTTVRPAARVLFLSGYPDDKISHHGVLDADVAFLQKPFTPDALAHKVREVLDAR